MRWFSPTQEVDFCGHATLATAHILYTEQQWQGDAVFHTRAGVLTVAPAAQGYQMSLPRLQPQPVAQLPQAIATLLGTPPVAVFRDAGNFYVDMGSDAAVRSFVPDMAAIAQLGEVGLVVTGVCPTAAEADFVSRSFAPGVGISEDPVTGSTHATLVPYWAQQLGRTQLLAYQASPRGGWLRCELQDTRVLLTGDAVTFMQATIALPPAAHSRS